MEEYLITHDLKANVSSSNSILLTRVAEMVRQVKSMVYGKWSLFYVPQIIDRVNDVFIFVNNIILREKNIIFTEFKDEQKVLYDNIRYLYWLTEDFVEESKRQMDISRLNILKPGEYFFQNMIKSIQNVGSKLEDIKTNIVLNETEWKKNPQEYLMVDHRVKLYQDTISMMIDIVEQLEDFVIYINKQNKKETNFLYQLLKGFGFTIFSSPKNEEEEEQFVPHSNLYFTTPQREPSLSNIHLRGATKGVLNAEYLKKETLESFLREDAPIMNLRQEVEFISLLNLPFDSSFGLKSNGFPNENFAEFLNDEQKIANMMSERTKLVTCHAEYISQSQQDNDSQPQSENCIDLVALFKILEDNNVCSGTLKTMVNPTVHFTFVDQFILAEREIPFYFYNEFSAGHTWFDPDIINYNFKDEDLKKHLVIIANFLKENTKLMNKIRKECIPKGKTLVLAVGYHQPRTNTLFRLFQPEFPEWWVEKFQKKFVQSGDVATTFEFENDIESKPSEFYDEETEEDLGSKKEYLEILTPNHSVLLVLKPRGDWYEGVIFDTSSFENENLRISLTYQLQHDLGIKINIPRKSQIQCPIINIQGFYGTCQIYTYLNMFLFSLNPSLKAKDLQLIFYKLGPNGRDRLILRFMYWLYDEFGIGKTAQENSKINPIVIPGSMVVHQGRTKRIRKDSVTSRAATMFDNDPVIRNRKRSHELLVTYWYGGNF